MAVGDLNIEKEVKRAAERQVSGEVLVGQLVSEHPEVLDTLMEVGMHCIGCPASQMESLSDAAMVHGLDPDAVVAAVNNSLAAD